MSRKYSIQELNVLTNQDFLQKLGISFVKGEIEHLVKGEGTVKEEYKANKVIEKWISYMRHPASRGEISETCVHRNEFSNLNNEMYFLVETLIRHNVISSEQIEKTKHILIAEKMPNICNDCMFIFAECEGMPQFSGEVFKDLEGTLADKVIVCNKFEGPKQEDSC